MSAIRRLESCNELASEIASPKFLPPLYPHVGDDETSSLAFLFDLSMYIRLIINTKTYSSSRYEDVRSFARSCVFFTCRDLGCVAIV